VAALQPRLTVVRKHPTGGGGGSDAGASAGGTPAGSFKEAGFMGTTAADQDLPSVMTCANYIKLPPYSSKQV
jgi:E3 ubiquitin-protein ligase TRIP12